MPQINPKKNIIFFSIDCRRQDCYQTFGGIYPSPNIDKLARKGILFKNMYAASASTVMSLSSMINGRYSHDFERYVYPESNPHQFDDNLFSSMQKSGRKNILIWQDVYKKNYAHGIYRGNDAEVIVVKDHCPPTQAAQYVVDTAKKIEDPYLIFCHFAPFEPEITKDNPSNPHGFQRELKSDDDAIGILLENIDLNETTIVFYSDHGFLKGERNLISHAFFLLQGVVRVPFIVTADKQEVISENYSLTQVKDLIEGKTISSPEYIYADTQYKGQPHRITMALKGKWKYIAHYSEVTSYFGALDELYNLEDDPNEYRNLLNDFSRHPLRQDWNQHDLSQFKGCQYFHYNQSYLNSKTIDLQAKLAAIWVGNLIELLEHIKDHIPGSAELLKMKETLKGLPSPEQIKMVRHVLIKLAQGHDYVKTGLKRVLNEQY